MDYMPAISAVSWPLLFFAMLAAMSALLRPRFLGAIREAAVSRKLRRYCAEVADHLILPDGRNGLTEEAGASIAPSCPSSTRSCRVFCVLAMTAARQATVSVCHTT